MQAGCLAEPNVSAVQVYASITPLVYLVKMGTETDGVWSLSNVTVRFSFLQGSFKPLACFRYGLSVH